MSPEKHREPAAQHIVTPIREGFQAGLLASPRGGRGGGASFVRARPEVAGGGGGRRRLSSRGPGGRRQRPSKPPRIPFPLVVRPAGRGGWSRPLHSRVQPPHLDPARSQLWSRRSSVDAWSRRGPGLAKRAPRRRRAPLPNRHTDATCCASRAGAGAGVGPGAPASCSCWSCSEARLGSLPVHSA